MKGDQLLDLFCGVGGFSLGAHLAGFRSALAIDLDTDLTATFPDNFPRTHLLHADISKLDPLSALEMAGIGRTEIVGVVGGPPCQGFSVIGRRNPEDERNQLVSHFFRFVNAIRPTFYVMENVPGILDPPFRRHLEVELGRIGGTYRTLDPLLLDAADFGAATRRRRVLIAGFLADSCPIPDPRNLARLRRRPGTVEEALAGLPPIAAGSLSEGGHYWAQVDLSKSDLLPPYAKRARAAAPPGLSTHGMRRSHRRGLVSGYQPTQHTAAVRKRFASLEPGRRDPISRFPRMTWQNQAPALRAGTGKDRGNFQAVRPIHPDEARVITVREAARLQGFPDWFLFHPARWHSFRMIGNSVSPYLARAVLSWIRRAIEHEFRAA